MMQSEIPERVLHLTPDQESGPQPITGEWPIPPTNPPITIPGINADGSHFPIEKIEAHIKGQHHQALSVFVFSGDELLIQRRAFEKYHCGGLWANTCCTHPHFGENIDAAVQRRLQEELGFQTPVEQRLIVEYSADVGNGLWERERVHMFRTNIAKTDIEIKPNPDEVCEVRWINADELRQEINNHPENFTPWFRIYVNEYPELDF